MNYLNEDYLAMGGGLPRVVPARQPTVVSTLPPMSLPTSPLQMTAEQHLEQLSKLLQNPMVLASLSNETFLKNLQTINALTAPVPMPTSIPVCGGKRKLVEETVPISPEFPRAITTSYTPRAREASPPPMSPPLSPLHNPTSAFDAVLPPSNTTTSLKSSSSPVSSSPPPSPAPKTTSVEYNDFANFISPNGGAYAAFPPDPSRNSYSSALHQLVLLQHWIPILEKLSPANKAAIWETCMLMPTFKNYNKNSFRKTITAWATNILPNMASITILFGAIGYLKHHGTLKNEFCFPNTNNPVFRTFITNPIPGCNVPAKKAAPVKAPVSTTSTLAPTCQKESEKLEPCWKRPRIMELASIINA